MLVGGLCTVHACSQYVTCLCVSLEVPVLASVSELIHGPCVYPWFLHMGSGPPLCQALVSSEA